MTKLIETDSIIKYAIVDSVEFKSVRISEKDIQLFINELSIDTTGIKVRTPWRSVFLLTHNNKIYFNSEYKKKDLKNLTEKKIVYSMTDGSVAIYDYDFDYDLQMMPYKIDRRQAKIYKINPETGNQTLFVDFWDIVKKVTYIDGKEGAEEDIEQIVFFNNNYAYIALCYNDGSSGDGCTDNRYFIVNGLNSKVDITNKIRPKYNAGIGERLGGYRSEMQFISNDGKYIKDLCFVDIYNVENKKEVFYGNKSRLFDIQFNYIGDLLYLEPRISGINIQKGEIQNYFLGSNIDVKDSTKRIVGGYANKYVIIPYVFNPILELAMYKAYNDNLLIKEDLKGLEKYELDILRNVIFAKYNYSFSSEFYQAYFNLYKFYGDWQKQKSRAKDVSHLLTEADKANIKFIKQMEK
jgi:hypothetical protein